MNSRFVVPLFIVSVLVILSTYAGGVSPANAQSGPPPTGNNHDGANAGEVIVAWDAVPEATHYRIGYVNMEIDYHFAKASCTGEWIEAFLCRCKRAKHPGNRRACRIHHPQALSGRSPRLHTSNDFVDRRKRQQRILLAQQSQVEFSDRPGWLANWHPDPSTGLFRAGDAAATRRPNLFVG